MSGVPASHFNFLWQTLIYPRLGFAYSWGGSLNPNNLDPTDPAASTDCSGLVSAVLSALVRGPAMEYTRQFWTGTFAGINPGDRGPFAGLADTADLVCISSPGDAPPDAAMVIAILQTGPDPTYAANAHMICSVRGTVLEMGGGPDNLHTGGESGSTEIDDSEFNQFMYLPGPVILDAPDYTAPSTLAAISGAFAA